MRRILFAADLHGDMERLEGLKNLLGKDDTLVLAGDLFGGLTNRPNLYPSSQVASRVEEVYGLLRDKLAGIDFFTVKGNWDPDLYHEHFGDVDLAGRVVERAGWRLTGFSEGTHDCSPVCMDSSFFRVPDRPLDHQALASAQVWVSHFPPKGSLDTIMFWEHGIEEHIGNANLTSRVLESGPLFVICGHIHYPGEERLGVARVIRSPASQPFVLEEHPSPG